VNGTQLREVKMNPNFRAVFVITERTLNDLGKDVSRALRNRCVELKMHYNHNQSLDMKLISSFDQYDMFKVSPQMLVSVQLKHDRLTIGEYTAPSESLDVKLGKRKF